MSDPLKYVNSAGFAFQLAIEEIVKREAGRHGWAVTSYEHPWMNGETPQFLDLVLTRGTIHLAVECKRHRDALWTFLVADPRGTAEPRRRLRAPNLRNIDTSDGRSAFTSLTDFQVEPVSWESSFCSVPGAGEGDRVSTIDRLCGELTRGTDALLGQLHSVRSRNNKFGRQEMPGDESAIGLPVIVTTAKLMVCRFDPAIVGLDRGEIDPTSVTPFEVPFVRYRKSFDALIQNAPDPHQGVDSLESLHRYAERTVSIVGARYLVDWLSDLSVRRASY